MLQTKRVHARCVLCCVVDFFLPHWQNLRAAGGKIRLLSRTSCHFILEPASSVTSELNV